MADIIPINQTIPTVQQLMAEFNRPIPPDLTAEATEILLKLSLPVENVQFLTIPQFNILNGAVEQLTMCKNCDGNNRNCDKITYTAEIVDGKLVTQKMPCELAQKAAFKRQVDTIIQRAKIPPRFRHFRATDYDASDRNADAIDAAEAAILDGASLYIHGDVGTGKTMLACIIAVEFAHRLKSCRFVNVPDLMESLREFNQIQHRDDDATREEKLRHIYETKRLIVDDLGAEKPSDWTNEILFKIFNRRYNDCSQTIVTSNLPPSKLKNHVGDRVARRVLHDAEIVQIF